MKENRKISIGKIILLTFIVIWAVSLIKCKILTHKYFSDFEFAYTQNTMLGDMEYFKVLNCDGQSASVYYVEDGMSCAHVLTFEYTDGTWEETSWGTIWSTTGSASEVIFPYWWHFIYGGL